MEGRPSFDELLESFHDRADASDKEPWRALASGG